ncbi:MAG: thioredoxin domain-containing protein, partial [Lachnospiraceae bacterium]|nr:thioredoxin domain-containing protein [Lachnospiraceae bacterium]
MSNHLKDQSSPYLLQHAENPVDWYPWGEEAFAKAKAEDKPVFLSIGYSTCHWCHVMEQESFENLEIAEILNKNFVSIKVDREERPDIDSVYMSVCQALTGNGGWPMSIFMTPEQKPFFAGTYFPPISSRGIAGMHDLLIVIAEQWKCNKEELILSAERILTHIRVEDGSLCEHMDTSLPDAAAKIFAESFDEKYGGFGGAPKFPSPHNLLFLMLYAQINGKKDGFAMAFQTLESMRRGGIFDHIGFGFSRYSTDKYFLVPHFEKMLYDNALLVMAYAVAYKISGDESFLDTAEKTAAYVLRDLTDKDGAFYSAQDADSGGVEGRFYTWRYEDVLRLLGKERGRRFSRHFGITERGNYEGRNIPNLLNENEIVDSFEGEKELMYAYRKTHYKLHLDDKILTSWNSLMICGLALLYRTTGKEMYLKAAVRAQQFVERNLAYGNTLYVSFRNHIRFVKGFLDEYAYYTAALLSLYEATGEEAYLKRAEQICKEARRQFADEGGSGYFLYGEGNDSLIMKPKETYDGALPSGNSVMAYCFVRLFQILGDQKYECLAKKQLAFLSGEAGGYPAGHCMFLIALLFYLNPPRKITVV